MSDFRKIGPAVVDADQVKIVLPSGAPGGAKVRIIFKDGDENVIYLGLAPSEVTDDDLIKGAINEFYRPYNPPGAVFYEPKKESDEA